MFALCLPSWPLVELSGRKTYLLPSPTSTDSALLSHLRSGLEMEESDENNFSTSHIESKMPEEAFEAAGPEDGVPLQKQPHLRRPKP